MSIPENRQFLINLSYTSYRHQYLFDYYAKHYNSIMRNICATHTRRTYLVFYDETGISSNCLKSWILDFDAFKGIVSFFWFLQTTDWIRGENAWNSEYKLLFWLLFECFYTILNIVVITESELTGFRYACWETANFFSKILVGRIWANGIVSVDKIYMYSKNVFH